MDAEVLNQIQSENKEITIMAGVNNKQDEGEMKSLSGINKKPVFLPTKVIKSFGLCAEVYYKHKIWNLLDTAKQKKFYEHKL